MESAYDYRKCTVLYVDDEEMALKYFTRAFDNRFPILTAVNAADGYRKTASESALSSPINECPGKKGCSF
jgi:response regulator RpfG family c-di-GMP phosphodiesterase